MTELEIDIESTLQKNKLLKIEQDQLHKILIEKDKQIFNEEKQVKELLSSNINNFTHEDYLKHKKE